jgi:hypothetical protein
MLSFRISYPDLIKTSFTLQYFTQREGIGGEKRSKYRVKTG